MGKINLADKLATFTEHWSPRTVALYNGHDVMVVKVEGEFVWHSHADTDDFFLVLGGTLDIELRDRTVVLGPGELFIVPKGVEHRPVARSGEVTLLLIEPTGTPNTDDAKTAAANLTSRIRMSLDMARTSLRKFSAWRDFSDWSSSRDNLVTPSTIFAISGPNKF